MWIRKEEKRKQHRMQGLLQLRHDQHGATLVELMVAIAIASIVLAGVAYVIIYAMRMYGKSSARVELQNEAQSTLNYLVDTTMQADGIAISYTREVESGGVVTTEGRTECVLFGKLYFDSALMAWMYDGVALVADTDTTHCLYLVEFPNAGYPGDTVPGVSKLNANDSSNVNAAILEIRDYVLANESVQKAGLMANYVTKCYIYVKDEMNTFRTVTDSVTGISEVRYVQPLGLSFDLEFETTTGTGTINKTAQDSAAIRNAIGSIYVNGTKYGPLLN